MVRVKKRYFVIQFERERQVIERAWVDPESRSLPCHDAVLNETLKRVVHELFGDQGRAAVSASGLRAVYANATTGLMLVSVRHGPHRFVGAALPWITRLKHERVVPRLIYTGATLRHCYQRMEAFQMGVLTRTLLELRDPADVAAHEALKTRLMAIRKHPVLPAPVERSSHS